MDYLNPLTAALAWHQTPPNRYHQQVADRAAQTQVNSPLLDLFSAFRLDRAAPTRRPETNINAPLTALFHAFRGT